MQQECMHLHKIHRCTHHTCRHICIGTYKHKDTYTHLHGYACADSVFRVTCEHAFTDASVNVRNCACVHTQKSIHTHAHTFTHIRNHTFSSPSAEAPLAQPEITGDKSTEFK